MNLNKIFFSYSRTDASDFTLRLAVDLKKEGFNVWIDQQDIRAGTEWDLEIEKALETCDCLLFIESEKSVTSNNVLDEVYYALEQRKRVIPVIYHDSKTPFRLQRLQHIDFTKNYETGLGNLIKELRRVSATEVLQSPDGGKEKVVPKTFFATYSRYLLLVAALLIIGVVVAIIYSTSNKKEIDQTDNKSVNINDTLANEQQSTDVADSISAPKNEDLNTKKIDEKKATGSTSIKTKKPVNKIVAPTESKIENLVETFAGDWELAGVEPKAASNRGYLKIEPIDEKKVKILSSFQFYFFKTNAAAYFVVFNGFAACSSCVLQNEIKFTDKDIAFGSNMYEILKEDQPGEGKAGDTVMTAGANNTISALVTLHLINKNTIIIKVQQSAPTPVGNGLVVEPFVYTFRFRKGT
jgi:cbb3-type cytochrome oxidase subunit 3